MPSAWFDPLCTIYTLNVFTLFQVAFGSDLSQDSFVSSILAPNGGLLATLDNFLHGLEKLSRNPLQKVLQDYNCVMRHVLTSFIVCAIWREH